MTQSSEDGSNIPKRTGRVFFPAATMPRCLLSDVEA